MNSGDGNFGGVVESFDKQARADCTPRFRILKLSRTFTVGSFRGTRATAIHFEHRFFHYWPYRVLPTRAFHFDPSVRSISTIIVAQKIFQKVFYFFVQNSKRLYRYRHTKLRSVMGYRSKA